MKKHFFAAIMAILLAGAFLPGRLTAGEPTKVYYFHMTRRCVTCQTVEKVTEQALKDLYPEAVKNGSLTFQSVNIEEKGNKALTKKMKVGGQSLLIVNGTERFDITDKGFMYAVNEPDKLKAEMKTILEKLVK